MKKHYKNLWEQLNGEFQKNESKEEFLPFIYSTAKRLTKNEEAAKELTQSVSESFLKKRPLKNIKDVFGLTYSSVRNQFLNIIKSNKTRLHHEGEYALAFQEGYEIDGKLFARSDLDYYQQLLLLRLKSQLKEKDFDFLMMLHSGMSLEEIAKELGVSVKRIKNRRREIYKKIDKSKLLVLAFLFITNLIQNTLNLVQS